MKSDELNLAVNNIFNSIIGSRNKELDNAVDNIPEELKTTLQQAMEKFNYEQIHLLVLEKFTDMKESLIRLAAKENKTIWLMLHISFVENQFSKQIKLHEGFSCSHDKVKTIIKALLRWFEEGREIHFNYEQEYTYHLPTHIFNTHDEVINFFNAIHDLYYGKPDKYLQCLLALAKTKTVNADKDNSWLETTKTLRISK